VLPGINTKMMIAVCGLVALVTDLISAKCVKMSRISVGIFLISLLFSLVSYASVVYNNTYDLVYATYFVKMSVWFAGAYFVVKAITWGHGRISIQLIFHYLALLCAVQCLFALLIDNVPSIENWIRTTIADNYEFIAKNKRLYGIGASYDTAGIRFSVALIGLMYLMINKLNNKYLFYYMILWAFIVVIGSSMSRTTSIGAILSLCYLLLGKSSMGLLISHKAMRYFIGISTFAVIAIFISIYCYNNIPSFKEYVDFGFENFFNYSKTGEFTSSSTNNLKKMFILPDNIKTWVIGDGLFDVPGGFYMSTDVGYLRLIFYSGLLGLLSFSSLFIYCTIVLIKRWPHLKTLFIILLVWQAIVWVKISTDIFVIFALLALIPVDGDKLKPIFYNEENKHDI
jgi:hypothetical protein